MLMLMLPGGYSSMIQALLLIALIPLAAAQELEPFCLESQGNYSAGSTYETNLLDLLGRLGQTASSTSPPSLFARASLGAAPDTVRGLVLCRGDVSASDCSTCVTRAGGDAVRLCNRSRGLALLYEKCFVRISPNQSILDPASDSDDVEVRLPGRTNITSTDPEGYANELEELLGATVKYAVDNYPKMFATGQWEGFHNIYSASQCAADLSQPQCRNCLETQLHRWSTEFPRYVSGGRMAGPRCTLRSESTARFYNGRAMVLLPTTAAPTTGQSVAYPPGRFSPNKSTVPL